VKAACLVISETLSFPYSRESIDIILKDDDCPAFYMIGSDPPVTEIAKSLDKVSPNYILVLISGTGWDSFITDLYRTDIPLIAWFLDDPNTLDYNKRFIHYFHTLYSVEKNAVAIYKRLGHRRAAYLPHGADVNVFHPEQREHSVYQSDICVVGSACTKAAEIIRFLISQTDWRITTVGRGWNEKLTNCSISPRLKLINYWISPRFERYFYSSAKVVLTGFSEEAAIYNAASIPSASPPVELFRAAACGAFQITQRRRETANLFPSAKLSVHAGTKEECLALASLYLADNNKRLLMGEATLREINIEHTLRHRLRTITASP
jgi:spore maturation protein CgeB